MNNLIPAVDKAVQILLMISRKSSSQSELSRSLGISMSTTYRILTTLQKHSWCRKQKDGTYVPGTGLLPLLESCAGDEQILRRAEDQVTVLSEKYQIACKLSVRHGLYQMTRFRAEPPGPVVLTGQSKSLFPLIEGSVGAALLCHESPETCRELAGSCPDDIPEKEDPELLFAGIREIGETGVCFNLRKNRWQIAACSTPVLNRSGQVLGALSIIGLAEDFSGSRGKQLVRSLREAAAFCSRSEVQQQRPSEIHG